MLNANTNTVKHYKNTYKNKIYNNTPINMSSTKQRFIKKKKKKKKKNCSP